MGMWLVTGTLTGWGLNGILGKNGWALNGNVAVNSGDFASLNGSWLFTFMPIIGASLRPGMEFPVPMQSLWRPQ